MLMYSAIARLAVRETACPSGEDCAVDRLYSGAVSHPAQSPDDVTQLKHVVKCNNVSCQWRTEGVMTGHCDPGIDVGR